MSLGNHKIERLAMTIIKNKICQLRYNISCQRRVREIDASTQRELRPIVVPRIIGRTVNAGFSGFSGTQALPKRSY